MIILVCIIILFIKSSSQQTEGNINSLNKQALRGINVRRHKPSYIILTPKIIQPDRPYVISVNIFDMEKVNYFSSYKSKMVFVQAVIHGNGNEIARISKVFKAGIQDSMTAKIPLNLRSGDQYTLKIIGQEINEVLLSTYQNSKMVHKVLSKSIPPMGKTIFSRIIPLTYNSWVMAAMIQLNKPIYKQGQNVKFRVILLKPDFTPYLDTVNVYIKDPKGNILKRWLNRQSNLGSLNLEYQLGRRPPFGIWKITATALGQTESTRFLVEEYFENLFEVNVTTPQFFMENALNVDVRVEANYSYYAGVYGKAKIEAYLVNPEDTYKSRSHVIDIPVFKGGLNLNIKLSDIRDLVDKNNFNGRARSKPISGNGERGMVGNHVSIADYHLIVRACVNDPRQNKTFCGFNRARIFPSSPKRFVLLEYPNQHLANNYHIYKPGFNMTLHVAVSEPEGSPVLDDILIEYEIQLQADGSNYFYQKFNQFIPGSRYIITRESNSFESLYQPFLAPDGEYIDLGIGNNIDDDNVKTTDSNKMEDSLNSLIDRAVATITVPTPNTNRKTKLHLIVQPRIVDLKRSFYDHKSKEKKIYYTQDDIPVLEVQALPFNSHLAEFGHDQLYNYDLNLETNTLNNAKRISKSSAIENIKVLKKYVP